MLTIETWPIERLIPYARNPRKNDAVVDQMVAAIKEFGFRIPIMATSDGTIIDGHLRLKAAQRLGLTELPVTLADDMTEAQIKAFRLLANRSVAWAQWDNELLSLELKDLQELGYDLGLTGFDAEELKSLTEDDDVRQVSPMKMRCRKLQSSRSLSRAIFISSAIIACFAATAPCLQTWKRLWTARWRIWCSLIRLIM